MVVVFAFALALLSVPPAASSAARNTSVAASSLWPVEPSVHIGFLLSSGGVQPGVVVQLFAPVVSPAGAFVLAAGTYSPGALDVTVTEGVFALGIAAEGSLDSMRVRAGVGPGVIVHHFSLNPAFDTVGVDSDTTIARAALVAPVEIGLPLGHGMSFTVGGFLAASSAIEHDVNDTRVWSRGTASVMATVGVTFGGP
jgi:hypothetical protein